MFLNEFYVVFLARVAEGRGIDRDQVHTVAQGRVWTGAQALERGLVDDLGGLDVAIAQARDIAGVTEETGILRLPRQRTFLEELLDDIQNASIGARAGDPNLEIARLLGAEPALQALETMARVLGPDAGVAAMPPCLIEVR